MIPTVADSPLAASVVNEDATHGFGGGGKEVAATIKLLIPDETQVRFMNQRSGLKGVVGLFLGHAGGGEFSKFVVNEWQQLGGGLPVAEVRGL